MAGCVVKVASGSDSASAAGAVAGRAVDLDEMALGVVEILMGSVVEQVSGGVVGVAIHAIVVLRIRGIITGEGQLHGVGAVLLPAVAKAVVDIAIDGLTAVFVGADKAIEGIIGIRPVAVDTVACGQNIAVGCEGSDVVGVCVGAVKSGRR